MALLIYILVIIGALLVIASGFWVVLTLAKVVSPKGVTRTPKQVTPKQKSEH